jgi:hypothetical protein
VGSCSDLCTVLLFCLYFSSILVCNFACDLCCFIVNVYSLNSSVELMLYCFIMCRIKIKFSYLILLVSGITFTKYAKCHKIAKPYKFLQWPKEKGQKDKQRSTKLHRNNERFSNTNPHKNYNIRRFWWSSLGPVLLFAQKTYMALQSFDI